MCVCIDLRHAMDVIARSRMEAASFANTKITTESIGIVANLALITENVAYIVSEGGISVFLSIIAGKIRDALSDLEAAKVLASGIRAVGRLLITPENLKAFIEEGGMETFKNVIQECGSQELVMNAIVDAFQNMIQTNEGKTALINSHLVPLITQVFKDNPHFTYMVSKYTQLLTQLGFENDDYCDELMEYGFMEAIAKNLQTNQGNGEKVIQIMDFSKEVITR